jgi:hypothetical protein
MQRLDEKATPIELKPATATTVGFCNFLDAARRCCAHDEGHAQILSRPSCYKLTILVENTLHADGSNN